jgi:uncharacterized protein DUF6159
MNRIERAFRLLGASWEVLKKDRELIVLPVVSGILTLAIAATFFGAAWGTGALRDGSKPDALAYVFLGLFYFCAYFISIFFNAAVVAAATIRLSGGDPTVGDGLRAAREKLGPIAAWAAIAATVGLILRALEERAGFLARIVISIIGVAWTAITFFVVPVILFEPVGATDAVKRSASIFKQRWGETLVGTAGIGLAMFILSIPVILLAVVLGSLSVPLGVLVGMIGVGGLAAVGAAMSGIFNAALYRFATTGEATGPFQPSDLQGTFREQRRGLGGGSFGGFGGGFSGR